jgi:hypothetical protein
MLNLLPLLPALPLPVLCLPVDGFPTQQAQDLSQKFVIPTCQFLIVIDNITS